MPRLWRMPWLSRLSWMPRLRWLRRVRRMLYLLGRLPSVLIWHNVEIL
jgi:hypothetical protein